MKHILSLLLAGLHGTAWAQAPQAPAHHPANVVSLNVPAGRLTNERLQYERVLSPRFGLGARLAWYYGGDWPGWQAEAFGRYYFRPAAPAGFYAQLQVGAFHHRGQESAFYPDPQHGLSVSYASATVSGIGPGAGLGYQWLPGARKRLAIDAMVGFKLYLQRSRGYCDCSYVGDWYDYGPGALFNGRLGLGYAF